MERIAPFAIAFAIEYSAMHGRIAPKSDLRSRIKHFVVMQLVRFVALLVALVLIRLLHSLAIAVIAVLCLVLALVVACLSLRSEIQSLSKRSQSI